MFLHRFEQRALHLARRAVDFIGQHEVGEDGALACGVNALHRIVDERARDVRRQQIGRELDARERAVRTAGQRIDGQRLRQPGQTFEQHMPACHEADEQSVDERLLADDDLLHFGADAAKMFGRLGDLLFQSVSRLRHSLGKSRRGT